jgi:D-alanyl-D-alanine carboxypeptidase/D-alanyl-D-alanine-endopeptidase (penicillin-binding protein 4)
MKPKNLWLTLLLFLVTGMLAGCAPKSAATMPTAVRAVDSIDYLRADLDRIFADPNFADAQWAVEVLSLDRGDVLYERNAYRLCMPASNNKIVTTVPALLRLGPDFRYETQVSANGEIIDGVLKGELVITGAGDPTAAPRFHEGDPFRLFKEWASRLKEKGIRKIEGDIAGDGSAFPPPGIGAGWEWDDLLYGYAAPISALQFNENLFTLEIVPGEAEGAPAAVRCLPLPDYVSFDSRVTTAAPGSENRVDIRRGPGEESLVLEGAVAREGKPERETLAVQHPIRYFLFALRKTLQEEGIDVGQATVRSSEDPGFHASAGSQLLWVQPSPPLSEIIKPLLKVSQNLYAETLARTLGLAVRKEGTFDAGRTVVEEVLERMAVPKGTYAYVDGSGLSRSNLVTADMLIRILKYMYRQKSFSQFYDALPIAGVDGTIGGRMKGTQAENNVHGKTGSIRYVRCLSGYVRTSEGEMLAFAMLANNFLVSSRAAEYVQDSALQRLAAYHRK